MNARNATHTYMFIDLETLAAQVRAMGVVMVTAAPSAMDNRIISGSHVTVYYYYTENAYPLSLTIVNENKTMPLFKKKKSAQGKLWGCLG